MDTLFQNFVMLGAVSSFIALFVVLGLGVASHIHSRRIEQIFTQIYKESEERIGKANTMVEQCTNSVRELSHTASVNMESFDKVTSTFVQQIENLQKQRDELTKQNHDLIRTNAELTSILSIKKDQIINFNAQEK